MLSKEKHFGLFFQTIIKIQEKKFYCTETKWKFHKNTAVIYRCTYIFHGKITTVFTIEITAVLKIEITAVFKIATVGQCHKTFYRDNLLTVHRNYQANVAL